MSSEQSRESEGPSLLVRPEDREYWQNWEHGRAQLC